MRIHRRLPAWALSAACGVLFQPAAGVSAAGPSTEEPEGVFTCCPIEINQTEYAAAVEAYRNAVELIRAVEKKDAKGSKRSMLLPVGKAHTAANQAERRIKRLKHVGEPAGFELDLRMQLWVRRLKVVIDDVLMDEEVKKSLAGTQPKWLNKADGLRKQISKAEHLANEKKWDAAATVLYDCLDALTTQGVWYGQDLQSTGLNPFRFSLNPIEKELFLTLHDQAANERRAAVQSELPNFEAAQAEIDAALQAMAAAGKASFDGQELAGPALLTAMGGRWKQLQMGAYRTRSHAEALEQLVPEGTAIWTKLEQDHERFTGAMVQACTRLIEADAGRASPAEAAALHHAYVEALVELVLLDRSRALTSGVAPALDKLAQKSPQFATELKAYSAATSELLRWRGRAADAQADGRRKAFPESIAKYEEIVLGNFGDPAKNTTPKKVNREGVKNNFAFEHFAPNLIEWASPKVVGQMATFAHLVPSPSGGLVGMYENRHYGRVSTVVDLSDIVNELRRCLFVDEKTSPPTLEASLALASAQRGECLQLGAEILAFELEAFMSRFTNLSDADWGFAALGSMARESHDAPPRQLLVAFDVKPVWAQHAYGFVELPR
ncbi:MAG TPA: hypothetical protein VGX76_09450 [Pirellulales bacterium]|nr:hypothetical protein [Pirellulales bacterium]